MSKREHTDTERLIAIEYRLLNIESVLKQILEMLQIKRAKSHKQKRTSAERLYQSVVASGFVPTEEQRKAARLTLARMRQRDIKREAKRSS